ncbi:MAG: hypothetical protein RKE49_06335 [Oceanicaulis sp.]
MITRSIAAAAGLAAAVAGTAAAQDWTRPAAFGGTELSSGFSPDPHVRNLTAGGTIRAAARFSNCTGYIADAPDYSVSYQAGGFPLIFTADSDRDTTLIINDPNGDWWCDDDGAQEPLNPMIRFDQPASGRYDVWVGTYASGAGVPAALFISEIGEHTRESVNQGYSSGGDYSRPGGGLIEANTGSMGLGGGSAASAGGPNPNAAPLYRALSLSAGFSNDPRSIELTAGGAYNARDIQGASCTGNIASAPDVSLNYSAGSFPLTLTADSREDTTLVVRGPDGRWSCDDDGADAPFNPLITFDNPRSGEYDIWVGTFGDDPAAATLYISELGEPALGGTGGFSSGGGVDITATPRHSVMRLDGGFLPDPEFRRVTAGGPLSASDAVQAGCSGSITREPTVELRYDGSGSLYIYTSGGADTTLAINRPDGSWVCNDDGAAGTNAGLRFTGSTSGTYDIYVGTFGGGQANTTLNVSELGMDR